MVGRFLLVLALAHPPSIRAAERRYDAFFDAHCYECHDSDEQKGTSISQS
jgi:hypothetical protein